MLSVLNSGLNYLSNDAKIVIFGPNLTEKLGVTRNEPLMLDLRPN